MISSHKYQQQIALHQRAVAWLGLKIKAIKRISLAEDNIRMWDTYPESNIRLMYPRRHKLEDSFKRAQALITYTSERYARIAKEVCQCIPVVEIYDREVQGINYLVGPNVIFGETPSFTPEVDWNKFMLGPDDKIVPRKGDEDLWAEQVTKDYAPKIVEPSGAYGYDNFWYNSHQK